MSLGSEPSGVTTRKKQYPSWLEPRLPFFEKPHQWLSDFSCCMPRERTRFENLSERTVADVDDDYFCDLSLRLLPQKEALGMYHKTLHTTALCRCIIPFRSALSRPPHRNMLDIIFGCPNKIMARSEVPTGNSGEPSLLTFLHICENQFRGIHVKKAFQLS
ncbi:hypothetical protein HYFRA_00009698 [Hymenoscyphus fraxineus]|uniref:Uncharacterized protein n=1 Tax=Hymenoscyphus fraxineus TaxID=746836 RepID=A0A9N9KV57_9HELO|nr:hypothetical protein HYFRA_00009698 [Hymenoscyphus fraxineus]